MSLINVNNFINEINSHQLENLNLITTTDFVFIDVFGNKTGGLEEAKVQWQNYFILFPDYKLEITQEFEKENVFSLFGFIRATPKFQPGQKGTNAHQVPAAWLAGISANKISSWKIYADQRILNDGPIQVENEMNSHKKVTGLGGIFFKCKNPDNIKSWYQKHLGIETDKYGTSFEWRHADDGNKKGFTAWSPFKESTDYFKPSEKDFMINYRVQNLADLVVKLNNEGVTVCDEIESFEYGKFVHIMDPEGNKIELWEAVDDEYDKILTVRTK